MPNETGEGGARRGQQPQHGRADYEKRADREAKLELSSIVEAPSLARRTGAEVMAEGIALMRGGTAFYSAALASCPSGKLLVRP